MMMRMMMMMMMMTMMTTTMMMMMWRMVMSLPSYSKVNQIFYDYILTNY